MKWLAFIGLMSLLLYSCQGEETIVYILFDDSEGIHQNDPVLLNGVSVGKVLEVDITNDYQVLTTVQLSDSVDFPRGSLFEIQRQDLFTKGIYVELGESKTFLENGDTIQGIRSVNPIRQIPGSNPPKVLDEVKEILRNVNI